MAQDTSVRNPFAVAWNDALEKQGQAAETILAIAQGSFNFWYTAVTRYFVPIGTDAAVKAVIIPFRK